MQDVALGHALIAMKRSPNQRNYVIDVIPNTRALAATTHLMRDAAKHMAALDSSVHSTALLQYSHPCCFIIALKSWLPESLYLTSFQ